MRSLVPLLLTCAVAVGALASPARAQRGPWSSYLHPERRQGERYLRQGLARLVAALGPNDPEVGDAPEYVLLEQALLRFERARLTLGDDPHIAYYVAVALSAWERGASEGGTEYRTDEAIAAYERVRELDPTLYPARVAADLAVLHMRRHEFGRARAEYERALESAVPETLRLAGRFYLPANAERVLASLRDSVSLGTLHGNLAEVTMLTGDVRAALERYRAAIEVAETPVTRSLAQWGLALALDRSGDHEGALRQAARALRDDPIPPDHPTFAALHRNHGPFSVLHLDGVFFEPAYEIHAYEALGHEAAARDADEPRRHLARARSSWRLFLAEGGTSSRFSALARAHAERLEAIADGAEAPRPDAARGATSPAERLAPPLGAVGGPTLRPRP